MSKCNLFVQLNKTSFRQGEPITGEVRVRVSKDCRCKKLTLESSWNTHGQGTKDKGKGPSRILFKGTWRPSQEFVYPFRLPTASGPCTYHGRLINVVWKLRARADIPWALDPKIDQDIRLNPGRVKQYYGGSRFTAPEQPKAQSGTARIVLSSIGVIIAMALLIMNRHMLPDWMMLAGPLGLLLIAGAICFTPIRNYLASSKVGRPIVDLNSAKIPPGGKLDLVLRLKPARGLALNSATFSLKATEAATYRQGTRTRTVRQEVFDKSMKIEIDRQALRLGTPTKASASIALPHKAPCSFASPNNEVAWKAVVHLDIPNWPDWKQAYDIGVMPGPGYVPPGAKEQANEAGVPTGPPSGPRVENQPVTDEEDPFDDLMSLK